MSSDDLGPDDESILGDRRGGRTARGPNWRGSLRQRVAVARGLPQVVMKITGHYKGARSVLGRALYVAREGEGVLRTGTGEEVVGRAEVEDLVSGWAADFGTRANGRDATGFTLSLPPQLVQTEDDRKRALEATVAFLDGEFGGRFEYFFAAHDDTDHYHVHVIVKRRGLNGERLSTNRADLMRWRERFAEAAQRLGFEVDASPRYARGKSRSSSPFGVEQMRRRGESPEVDRGQGPGRRLSEASRRRAAEVNAAERQAYASAAIEAAREARGFVEAAGRSAGLELAGVLALYAARMGGPESGEKRPGWAQARPLVVAVYKILREESERLYGAELGNVARVRDELGNELERGRGDEQGDQKAAALAEARRLAAEIRDPGQRRRAEALIERLEGEVERGSGSGERDEEIER